MDFYCLEEDLRVMKTLIYNIRVYLSRINYLKTFILSSILLRMLIKN